MADNVTADAGSGGAVFATDDIGGVHYPITKITIGALDSQTLLSGGNGAVDAGTIRVTVASDSTGVLSVDDNGGSLTVDGTVTANLSATDNAVLDSIDAAVNGTLTVGSHAVTNAGTFAVQEDGAALTALQLIDDAVYTDATGTPSKGLAVMGTDGTNPQLVAVDTNGHLQVDVLSGGGSGTEYTEDAAAAANPTGTMPVLVRKDTPASEVSADGDVIAQRATAYGAAYVQILDSSGNFINSFGGSGGTSATDDTAFTAGSGTGTPAMGFFSTDTVDSGDCGVLAMDASRRLLVSIEADNVGIGGGTQYTEDAAAAANPVGNAMMVVRADSLGAVTSADGDNLALRGTNNGELYVKQTDAITANLSATDNAVLDSIDTAVTYMNTTVFNEDNPYTTADAGIPSLVVRDDTLAAGAEVSADGDYTFLRVDNNGALWIKESAALDVSAATVTVDLGANNDVTIDGSSIVHAEDAVHNTGDAGVMSLAVRNDTLAALAGTDGDYAPLQVNASGALFIQEGSALDVSGATVTITGDVAHDGADSGNPLKIGAKATNSIEGLTQVAANDRTDLRADLNGLLLNRPHTTLEEIITERAAVTTDTSTNFTNFAAGGAGVHNYITTIAIYNSSATDGYVDFRDGSAGAIVFTAPAPATGGSVINLPVPIKFAANTAVAYDVSGALSTVYISVVGFQAQG